MIIPDDKKKVTTLILSRMKKDGGIQNTEAKPEQSMEMDPLDAICEDFLHAIGSKSIQGIKDAMNAFYAAKESGEGDESEENDEE